jgi:GT2 family glycosyltransferase
MVATLAAVTLLVAATAGVLALVIPTLAGLLPRRRPPCSAPRHTFAILIPAHNEETTLPAALRSVAALDYPPDRVRVCVVADNCTDGTAAVARAAGVTCLVRDDPGRRGKGYALALGLAHLLERSPDVVLILDADCVLNPGALRAFDSALAAGADAVQSVVRSRNADDGPGGYVAAVGAVVDEGVAAGLDRLGLSVPLRGTGMAFRRRVLEAVPWSAFGVVEDAEYAGLLWAAAVRVRYCGEAVASCEAPVGLADLWRQRRRWRAAGVLGSKPLGLVLLALAAAAGLATDLLWWPTVLVLLTAAVYLRAAVSVGLSRRRLGLMLRSPGVVLRLGWLTLAGTAGRGPPATWERTRRRGEPT